ncbi:MAG TPA: glycosyltransferase [Polyangiaceae bacterium]
MSFSSFSSLSSSPSRAPKADTSVLKIVDVTEFWSERGGGVRSYLTNKARVLGELGVPHRVIASGPRHEESVLAGSAPHRSELIRVQGPALPYDPTYNLFVPFGRVRERLVREAPDVLEIHSPQLAALSVLSVPRRAFRVRTMVWHSDFIDTYLSWRIAGVSSKAVARIATEPLWSWVRTIAGRCTATIAASAWQARKLRERGVPRVHELRFGIDTGVFRPAARDEGHRRALLGGRRIPLFVSVGRLAGEKRWDVVIEGFRRFRARREAMLVVHGDGPERKALMDLARDVPDVKFLGFDRDRERLARSMASADALVHAGPFETFGLSVAEAVACGTPVIVASAGAARELAVDGCSEQYAWGDAEALDAALERLLRRDPTSVRRHALDASRNVVSIDQHFGALIALYRELLSTGQARR